ncbi:MAG: OmpA family protein [Actinobacteria bacterium]|nr:OmpA family protein [Actinomycetota bacterium]
MSKKKQRHEEHEEHVNHEAWVIPYADMLTLLMALFLVMWATSQVDVNKAREVAAGFADSLNIVGNGEGVGGQGVLESGAEPNVKPEILDGRALQALENAQMQAAAQAASTQQLSDIQNEITQRADDFGLSADVTFRNEDRGLIVSIMSEGVLFELGSAVLRPQGVAVLDQLAAVVTAVPNQIVVEGHTDNVPIATAQYPSNWELSTARATAVLRYLVEVRGVPKERIAAAGYGEQRPIADNASTDGRSRNRRVDIAVLAEATVVELSDGSASVTPTTMPIDLEDHHVPAEEGSR